MAKVTNDLLITELCKRLGFDVTAAGAPRADVLFELDAGEKYIQQNHSLLNLVFQPAAITLANNASSAAMPANVDYGKPVMLQKATLDGELEYVPLDEWFERGEDNYGDWKVDRPSYFTFMSNGAGGMTVLFKPANTSGGSLSFNVIAQRTLIALIDANAGAGSTSLLPEGFEKTILVDRTEGVMKRKLRRQGWESLIQKNDADIETFYGSYRMTKEKTVTDREQQERKVSRDKLAEGV